MLQTLKDYVISSRAERWARPIWNKLTGTKLGPYDAQVKEILGSSLSPLSRCIDIGCHKGLILDLMIDACPDGSFDAFEPLPRLSDILAHKYKRDTRVNVHRLAISD